MKETTRLIAVRDSDTHIRDAIAVACEQLGRETFDFTVLTLKSRCIADIQLTSDTSGPLVITITVSAKERNRLRRKALKGTRWAFMRKAYRDV